MFIFGGPPNVDQFRAKGDVQGLARALGYPKDAAVRRAAAAALGQIGGAQAARLLIPALHDADPSVRAAVAAALGALHDEGALAPLTAALEDADGDVRRGAVEALGQSGLPGALLPLVRALQDRDPRVQQLASEVLKRSGPPAVAALSAALDDAAAPMRQAAAETLDLLGWVPGLDAEGAAYWCVKGEWQRCVEIGAPALHALLVAYRHGGGDARRAIVAALSGIAIRTQDEDPRGCAHAVEALVGALGDLNADVRVAAAAGLVQAALAFPAGDLRTVIVAALVDALSDAREDVRRTAAAGLGSIADSGAAPALMAAARKDRGEPVRAEALRALGHMTDPQAIPALLLALRDKAMRPIAAAALDALGWQPGTGADAAAYWIAKGDWEQCAALGSPAIDALISVLWDRDEEAAGGAARALGRIGDARVVDALAAALRAQPGTLRRAAAQAMAMLGAHAVAALVETLRVADQEAQTAAGEALVAIGAAAVPALVDALGDDFPPVRVQAAAALGTIGDARAAQPLQAALADRDARVRDAAAAALARLGASSAT